MKPLLRSVIGVLLLGALCFSAAGNGGPFVLKYPAGDPAAKGVLARLDPDLKPAKETRLRVLKEDLSVALHHDPFGALTRRGNQTAGSPPLASVTAAYTIENPTDKAITVDFGFPILRGIYISPMSMMPMPDVRVTANGKPLQAVVIGNSVIYGLIRQRARALIEKAIGDEPALAALVAQARANQPGASEALAAHVRSKRGWNPRDAALLVAFSRLELGQPKSLPVDVLTPFDWRLGLDQQVTTQNLGPLSAIGEQKATQFFAELAAQFDPAAAAGYEAIFSAWGGDVRERSVDLTTGQVRPREIINQSKDPTIYARVDYLDPKAPLSATEKELCQTVLKNLPVVFTFAPMNLLHYQASFPARATQVLTVTYKQYAYLDTASPRSYQLAYVVHPASYWKEFGPIRLSVTVPDGVPFRASVPCTKQGEVHGAELTLKTGELFLALDADRWDQELARRAAKK